MIICLSVSTNNPKVSLLEGGRLHFAWVVFMDREELGFAPKGISLLCLLSPAAHTASARRGASGLLLSVSREDAGAGRGSDLPQSDRLSASDCSLSLPPRWGTDPRREQETEGSSWVVCVALIQELTVGMAASKGCG